MMKNSHLKHNLSKAYQILAFLSLDDHTYTHLSARPPNGRFYHIYQFGLRFEETEPNNLLTISLDGEVLEGAEAQYNKTGYIIHGSLYKARSDISAIFHVHTPSIVAVSAMRSGLMPISQWALHFYDKVSYYDYDSLILDESQGSSMAAGFTNNYVMFLRNHGAIACGRTIHEAMFYTYHLEQACKTQCLALSSGQPLILPSTDICKKAVNELLVFEQDLGKRDWEAWLRLIKRNKRPQSSNTNYY